MAEGGTGVHVQLYTCEICGQDGLNEADMKSHVLIEHVESDITCPFCDLEGTTAEEMNWHINAEHLDYLSPVNECNGINPVPMDLDTVTNGHAEIDNPQDVKVCTNGTDTDLAGPGSHTTKASDCLKPVHKISPGDEEQTRKRAKLFLDVTPASPSKSKPVVNDNTSGVTIQINGHDSSDTNPTPTVLSKPKVNGNNNIRQEEEMDLGNLNLLKCPLCEWDTTSPGEITRHVNIQHLDILSPSRPRNMAVTTDNENNVITMDTAKPSSSKYECPICGAPTESTTALELHVNSKHVDILSPDNPQVRKHISREDLNNESMHYCPICGMEYADTTSLTAHVDGHFSAEQTPVTEGSGDHLMAQEIERREKAAQKLQEQREFEKLQTMYGMNSKSDFNKQSEKNMERAVTNGQMSISDYYNRKTELQQASISGVDDGHSCTKGLIPRLKAFYNTSLPTLSRHWLCSPCDHYAASYGDKGWGCGYRNLQMLLSCLAMNRTFEQVLFNGRPLIPSIPKIQRLIEAAWEKGFDLEGCKQLGGKVVNTTKWIGATEIVATMSSLRIKCQLADFHNPSAPDGTHPRLFEWVRDYFNKGDADFKPPLYLQHQGHSRTIIGVEEMKDKSLRLLIFDPSNSRKHMQQFYGIINNNLMRSLRRSPQSMKAKQYQIVAVVGILTDAEYEESKIMKSDRIP